MRTFVVKGNLCFSRSMDELALMEHSHIVVEDGRVAGVFRTLPERYPELPPEVWHAISVHTSAAVDMGPLDEVLFVADGIEPLRPDTPGIERSRSLVGVASLDDLFWECFVGGIVYVLEGGRYLYPGTIEVYNALAARRAEARP